MRKIILNIAVSLGNYQTDENASQKIKDAYKSLHRIQKYVWLYGGAQIITTFLNLDIF